MWLQSLTCHGTLSSTCPTPVQLLVPVRQHQLVSVFSGPYYTAEEAKLRANSLRLLNGFPGITAGDIACIGNPVLAKSNPRLRALLDYDADSADPYPLSCPIVDSDDPNPFKAAFRSPIIARVSVVPANVHVTTGKR